MNVIIGGAGEVGQYIAGCITAEGYDVTIIDSDKAKVALLSDTLDAGVICGSVSSLAVLRQAGVEDCDLFLAVTDSDETNLVAASMAAKLGAAQTLARMDHIDARHDPDFSYAAHFRITRLFSPEKYVSLAMAAFIRNPCSLAVEHFAHGAVTMREVIVGDNPLVAGKTLREILFPEQVRVATITRQDILMIPTGDTVLQTGDHVILIGATDGVADFQKNFRGEATESRRVVIMGGGNIGLSLARQLDPQDFPLTIIEKDAQRSRELSRQLLSATILQGDGTNLALLQEEGIEEADFFVSATSLDEINIMSALQAKSMGVKNVLVRFHRPDFVPLIEKLGIDHAVSPRAEMAREVLTMLNQAKGHALVDIGPNSSVEILEIQVTGSALTGVMLQDLPLMDKQEVRILMIKRGDAIMVPNGESVLHVNDMVLVICKTARRRTLEELLRS